ncbi:MAG: HAD hydrolase-like protein [Bacteroidaceae bacterium]|nr:HAD hydrolase-like protein [Bacteroidaceae bacterium]
MYEKNIQSYLDNHGFERMDLKAVMFDMDGVLFDSMGGHVYSWVKAAKEVGLPMTDEEVYLNEGRTGNGTINLLAQRTWGRDATESEMEEIYALKAGYFNTLPPANVMPGAPEMLNMVRDCNLGRILVTGSGQKSLLDKLDRHFPGIFTPERMVTAFDVKMGKPYPEPYLMGLKKGELKANEAIVVENAPLGVQAAAGAGVFTVAVNTGPLADEVLWEAGANVVLPDVASFREFFPTFLQESRR